MPTARDYQRAIRAAARPVATQMGVDFAGADKQTRVMLRIVSLLLGVLCKVMVDAGVVTGAQLQAALDAAVADAYPDEPVDPVEPEP